MRKKVVITDVAAISALGMGFENIASAMSQPPHKSTVKDYEFHQFDKEIACFPVQGFDPVEVLGKKGLRTKDYSTKLLLGAFESLKGIMDIEDQIEKPGICVGTAFGSVQSIGDFLSDSIVNGVSNVNPQAFANTVINSPTGNANIRFLARNLSATVATGFNAGLDALIYSYDYIQSGYLERIATGGLEEISYYSLLGFIRSGVLSISGSMRPFATDSDGCTMGEGCALFVLETEEAANRRGVRILAEIAGTGSTFDSDAAHDGKPDGKAAYRAVLDACNEAGIQIGDIDFIASGANGSSRTDHLEAAAIKALGSNAPVTAYKAITGECFGASGALNTICALSDLKNGTISATPSSYPTIDNIPLVKSTIRKNSRYALIISCSCEGNCSALILKNVN